MSGRIEEQNKWSRLKSRPFSCLWIASWASPPNSEPLLLGGDNKVLTYYCLPPVCRRTQTILRLRSELWDWCRARQPITEPVHVMRRPHSCCPLLLLLRSAERRVISADSATPLKNRHTSLCWPMQLQLVLINFKFIVIVFESFPVYRFLDKILQQTFNFSYLVI